MENFQELGGTVEGNTFASTLGTAFYDFLTNPTDPTNPSVAPAPPQPQPLPPPATFIELNPVETGEYQYGGDYYGGYGHFLPQDPALYMMDDPNMYYMPQFEGGFMYADPLYSQAGGYIQEQHLQHNENPFMVMPEVMGQGLPYVGHLGNQNVYQVPSNFTAHTVAPPHDGNAPRELMNESQQEESRRYVKKPPNAFMVFMKEQRSNVHPDIRKKGSSVVNAFLGQQWRSMSKQQQAKYYVEADKERLLHKVQHPDWTSKENYGRKLTKAAKRKVAERNKV